MNILGCMVRALIACICLLPLPLHAATDYTDTWWTPSEPGWGVNLTQQNNFVFATFYVYASDGRPTWYTAQLTRDGTGDRFTGGLFRHLGTWFGAPVWQLPQTTQAGTATFTATSANTGTLVYSADGVNVSKAIERITLQPQNLAGSYTGAAAGTRSGCSGGGPLNFTDPVDIEILHSTTTGEIRISQYSTTSGFLICRMEGTAVQFGKLLLVDNATYTCPDSSWNSPARIYNLRPTTTGFEAQWFSNAGNGCTESGDLSGVRFR